VLTWALESLQGTIRDYLYIGWNQPQSKRGLHFFFFAFFHLVIMPEIRFFNNTPDVDNTSFILTVQFMENEGVQSSRCQLGPRTERNCKSKVVQPYIL